MPHDAESDWARRLARGCCIAAVLLFVAAPWLSREPANAPGDERIAGAAAPRGLMGTSLTAAAAFVTPAGRAALAFEALLGRWMESGPPVFPPGRGMTADDFRRLYEGDGAGYADVVFAAR